MNYEALGTLYWSRKDVLFLKSYVISYLELLW